MSIEATLQGPEWSDSDFAPPSLVAAAAAVLLRCGSDDAGNRESATVGGERAEAEAAETRVADEEEDDTGGDIGRDADVGNTFHAVLDIAAWGAGSGVGMPVLLAVEGAEKLRHLSRIEMNSWICLVRWGTMELARLTRRPSRVAALYVGGCLRVAEA